MTEKQPGFIRRGNMVAKGGGVAVIALVVWVLMHWGDAGTGGSENSSDPPAMATTEGGGGIMTGMPSQAEPGGAESEDVQPGGLTSEEQAAIADGILVVLVDGFEYAVGLPGPEETVYRPVGLERILEIAAETSGDQNGIRVRILRRESAKASAEERLKLELRQIGITEDHWLMPRELLP